MKYLFFFFICIAQAHQISPYLEKSFGNNQCLSGGQVSYAVNYHIIQKIDAHHYEIIGRVNGVIIHALLEAQHTQPAGRPMLWMKHTGVKTLPLANGFTAPFDLWKECSATEVSSALAQYRHTLGR